MTSIVQIRTSTSNNYLVIGDRPIIVDTGTQAAVAPTLKALAQAGISPRDVALIVLTHGHGDHAGGAAALREATGAPVLLHRNDAAMVRAGQNGIMHTTRLSARLWKRLIVHPFAAFNPDILIGETPFSLRSYGVDGMVVPTPGHTAGSVSVRLDSGEAIIGDVLMGGYMGGMLAPRLPRVHYFYEDMQALYASRQVVLRWPVTRLYVGHGGPLDIRAAQRRFAGLDESTRRAEESLTHA
jgi:hydroxyacylglutathione hydrolase